MVNGRLEDQTPRKCILQAEKHHAWGKKTLRRTFVSLGKTVFSPFDLDRKNNRFPAGNKSSPQSLSARHVSIQKEHIIA